MGNFGWREITSRNLANKMSLAMIRPVEVKNTEGIA